jgi:Phosphotransferase enzyme family
MQPEQLTPEFFSDLLGSTVTAVDRQRIGTGLVGMNVRCTLTYAAPPAEGAPRSLVAKLPSPDEVSRATGVATRTYEREAKFYRQVAHTVRIRVPRCWMAEWDEGTGDTTLILEDLAPGEPGDQLTGCTLSQARDAVVELARLHGPRWDDPSLDDLDWLGGNDADDGERLPAFYAMCFPTFSATYAPHLSGDQLYAAERLTDALRSWAAQMSGPRTVTHNDYRVDNLLFATPAGGDPVVAVDWQTVAHGRGTTDLAYFLGGSISVPMRREHERDLVDVYRVALASEGVEVSFDDLWEAYRHDAVWGPFMAVVSSTIVGKSDRSEHMFAAMATRGLQHCLDLDTLGLLG